MRLFEVMNRLRGQLDAEDVSLTSQLELYKGAFENVSRELSNARVNLDEKRKQIEFLERALAWARPAYRAALLGEPKKVKDGTPLNMKLLVVDRVSAALLVPGVLPYSIGIVGSFVWGGDSIAVKIEDDKACKPEEP